MSGPLTLVVDECVSDGSRARLPVLANVTIRANSDLSPRASDPQVLAFAAEDRALLLTNDKDFGELVFRFGASTSGVLLCRTGICRSTTRLI